MKFRERNYFIAFILLLSSFYLTFAYVLINYELSVGFANIYALNEMIIFYSIGIFFTAFFYNKILCTGYGKSLGFSFIGSIIGMACYFAIIGLTTNRFHVWFIPSLLLKYSYPGLFSVLFNAVFILLLEQKRLVK